MARFTNRSSFIWLHILQLMLIYNFSVSAAVLTYDGCMSDSANSYTVGGWCFLFYSNPSWGNNAPTQDGAQSVCLPHGSLAVGVTYKMWNKFYTNILTATAPLAWVALSRNLSYASNKDGWYWRTLLPTGGNATFPAIFSNIPWYPGEPDGFTGPVEDAAVVAYSGGLRDVRKAFTYPTYGITRLAVICQFAPPQWSFSQRGHGRMANSTYVVTRSTISELECVVQCYKNVFCVSLAFNPTTNDCQVYAVSPEDPRFSGSVTADSSYDWYIRDGMQY
uniref:Apple domain-containing protein n=1 Tax=Plectus sambesii TaxID=2011161 RepID=A0A914X857_9BILA